MITHKGIITKISDNKVTVRIAPEASECNGCAVSAICGKNEEIEVPYKNADKASIGTKVTIGTAVGMQRRGIILFFVVPILILIGVLAGAYMLKHDDTVAAIAALAALILWYLILYLFRVRVNAHAEFRILDTP